MSKMEVLSMELDTALQAVPHSARGGEWRKWEVEVTHVRQRLEEALKAVKDLEKAIADERAAKEEGPGCYVAAWG